MHLTLLKCKLHQARVTACDLHYEGSVSIDKDLMDRAGLLPFEKVAIWNITNGARIETYTIIAEAGSGTIGINGSAARHFEIGDSVIIAAFTHLTPDEAKSHSPKVVLLDEQNKPKG